MRALADTMVARRWRHAMSCMTVAWLALIMTVAGPALAHPGHRHVAEAQVEQERPATLSATAAISELPMSVTAEADVRNPSARSLPQPADVAATTFTSGAISSKSKLHCPCGSACGSCTSMSCCSAGLVPLCSEHHERPVMAVHYFATSLSLIGTNVSPLPRPPNPTLPA